MANNKNFRNSKTASFSDNEVEPSDEEEDEIQPEIDELLKVKVKLRDGSETYIFSRGPKQSEFKIWPVTCHLCKKQFIRTINEPQVVLDHATTVRHKAHVKRACLIPPEVFVKPFQQNYPRDMCSFLNPILIYPGEIITDVTTAYADRLVKIPPLHVTSPYFNSRKQLIKYDKIIAYNQNLPLLGLNGIIKIRPFSDFNVYYCTLCEGNEFYDDTCFQHITGKNHTNKYIEKYFSKLKKRLTNKLSDLDPQTRSKYIYEIVRYIYFKLEGWKTKREFTFIDYNSWIANRDKHLRYVRKSLYYHENIVKFSSEEIDELISKLRNKIELIPPDCARLQQQLTSKDIEKFKIKYEGRSSRHNSENHSGQSERMSSVKMLQRNRSTTKERQFETQHNRPEKKIICPQDDWKLYRKKCEQRIHDIDAVYATFIEKPDTHSNYKLKWEEFFKKRSQELKERDIDALNYDFASEWKNYWFKKLFRYYVDEIDDYKKNLRRKLELPLREQTPIYSTKGSLFDSFKIASSAEIISKSAVSKDSKRNFPDLDVIIPIQEKINVLYVLRLLNAIEDQLGTFATTASKFLTEAILFERETKSCSNKLLQQSEYYKFFITTLERLKGLLQAELVIEPKIKVVNKAISCLDQILKEFDESNSNIKTISNDYRSYLSVSPPSQKRFSYDSPKLRASTSRNDNFSFQKESSNFSFQKESSDFSTRSVQKMRTPSPPQGYFTESRNSYPAEIRRTPPPPIGYFPRVHSPSSSPGIRISRKRSISPQNAPYSNKKHSSNDENYQERYNNPFANGSSRFGNRNPSPPNKRPLNTFSTFSRQNPSEPSKNFYSKKQNNKKFRGNSRGWRHLPDF